MAPQVSPYPKVSLEEAWATMVRMTREVFYPLTEQSSNIVGRTAAQDVLAPRDFPVVRTSIVVFHLLGHDNIAQSQILLMSIIHVHNQIYTIRMFSSLISCC